MFAARKGRSSAYQLLWHLRRLSAFLLCSGMMLYCNWIPTEVNPADRPSRRYEFDSTLGFPGEGPRHNFLVKAAHLPKTRRDYEKAVRRFLTWADREGCSLGTVELLDGALADFFHDLYLEMDGGGEEHRCGRQCITKNDCKFGKKNKFRIIAHSNIILRK